MKRNSKVCIFCASSNHIKNEYLQLAYEVGYSVAKSGRDIIYGGGNVGMMGKMADGAISADISTEIIGVIPIELMNLELGHKGLTKLEIVDGMHPREAKMINESDCIIALPGGCGTYSELLQAITWKRLNLIKSPIIILNYNDFYKGLLMQLNRAIEDNFMNQIHYSIWNESTNLEDLMYLLDTLEPLKDNLRIKTDRNLA